jgi:hypothetical protein
VQNKYLLFGTLLLFAAIASMAYKPAAAAGTLTAGLENVPLGGSVNLTQTLDQKGKVKEFEVEEPDGDICEAEGGEVSSGSPLVRTYPDDFTIDEANGDGNCDTTTPGTYIVETLVKLKDGNQDDNRKWSFYSNSNNNNNDDDECEDDDDDEDDKKKKKGLNSQTNNNNECEEDDDDCEEDDDDDRRGFRSQTNNNDDDDCEEDDDDDCEEDDDDGDDDRRSNNLRSQSYYGDDDDDDKDDDDDDDDDKDDDDDCVIKNRVEFDTSFFVLPESPIGALALLGSSLGAFGGFYFLKKRSNNIV